jgi:CspA family cold shock protein
MTGTVVWFNDRKGYGFIESDADKQQIFVHYSGINKTGFKSLTEGSKVTFDTDTNDKGIKAVNVTVVN